MARKKEERGSGSRGKNKRGQNKKEKSRFGSGSEDLDIIKSQLLALGLSLRQVPGDGNCLFRALGDQLDGHMGNHYRHRKDTTNYMLEHHDDFQPFVEDDVPFEKHSKIFCLFTLKEIKLLDLFGMLLLLPFELVLYSFFHISGGIGPARDLCRK